ncbi:MAG: ring-1,2-phenylacetyl-CoA epoxidase subunit PaaB [Flavobacteriaceae bacterium]|jgi:ring-1,2-phenylacetyl-CoA epoxidase subunit PaaB
MFSSLKLNIMSKKNWPLWEIFVRSKNGLEHRHFGSLHATDAEMALENARDVYTRRNEGVSIWVVESKHITASNPENNGELFEPAQDKIYRHPTFYKLPDELKHM